MPIPALDENGVLPPGIYDCALEEIAARFGSFQESDRRPRLFAILRSFLAEVQASGLVLAVIIDGSFVSVKPAPEDIDLVLIVHASHDQDANLLPSQYNVVSKRRVRRRFGFDILVARVGDENYEHIVKFYQQVRLRPDLRKGVLRLTL